MSRQERQPASEGARKVSPARRTAFEILRRVEEENAFASVLLAAIGPELRAEDRALCYELVMGALRRQRLLDSLIEHFSSRNAEKLDPPVRIALRLGIYQLRFLSRIPASAIVNESVNLAYAARVRSAAGFINAVLRRAARSPSYDPSADITDQIVRLGIETSHPDWLIKRWVNALGEEDAARFAHSNNEAPPVAFRIVQSRAGGRDPLEELRAAGAQLKASTVTPGAWRIIGAAHLLRVLAEQGLIYVQDEASQLVAHVLDAKMSERVLDVCAAPGSKTTHIAEASAGRALIVAGDLYTHRLKTLAESAARQRARTIETVAYDATLALPFSEQAFDRVLVDAPCTGTGTLRRNPEIRWRISPSDITDLSARQRLILAHAARMVRGHGRLVYSTCSVEPEENEEVVSSFLFENPSFEMLELPRPTGTQTVSGGLRTWPHREGADGFFISAFERRT